MDFNKLKLKFEPEEEDKWASLKAKFEPEEVVDIPKVDEPTLDFDRLKAKFEAEPTDWEKVEIKPVDDVTTPAPITAPIQTPIGTGEQEATGGAVLPKPVEEFGLKEGISVVGGAIKQLPKQIKAAVLQATQKGGGAKGASVANKDWADKYIKSAQKDQAIFAQEVIDKYGDISFLGIKLSDIAQLPQSMAFSVTSMGAGLAAGLPFALTPLPGSRIVAWGVGTVASGKAAYEMSAYQIMQTYLDFKNEEKITSTGQELTLEEENNLKQGFNDLAKQYALWEAIPEAISNLAFVGLLTAPLTKMVGKTIAGRIVNKVAAMYGQETITEMITEVTQKGVMGKAGLPGGGEIDWTSPTEWVEAFKAVAPQTFLLTTIMGGTGTLIINTNKVIKSLNKEVKDSEIKEELIKKIENKETLKEAVKEEAPVAKTVQDLAGKGEVVYHGTSKKNAEQIRAKGIKPGDWGFSVSPDRKSAEEFGEVLEFTIRPDAKIATPDNLKGAKNLFYDREGEISYGTGEVTRIAKEQGFDVVDLRKFEAKVTHPKRITELRIINPDVLISVQGLAPKELEAKRGMLRKRGVSEKLLTDEFVQKAKIIELPKADVTTEQVSEETISGLEEKWGKGTELTKEKVLEKVKPPVTGEGKVSKIAKAIETKAIEAGLTEGFSHLAEYTPIVIKEQAKRASDLINTNINEARKIIRGEKPLPEGLRGTALITAMEEYIKKTADGELASELASSPLVSGTSAAAQELRLAAERDPESPVKAIAGVNKLLEERAQKRWPGKILDKAKADTTSKIKSEIKNANTNQSWKTFIESIRCS